MRFFLPELDLLSYCLSFTHPDLCGFIDCCGFSPCNLRAVWEGKVMDRGKQSPGASSR